MITLFTILVLFLTACVALFMRLTSPTRHAVLYEFDVPGLRSHVTFKPTPSTAVATPDLLVEQLCRVLAQHGATHHAKVHGVAREGESYIFSLSVHREAFMFTLRRLDKFPQEWLLDIQQVFRRGVSAPHDVASSRAALVLVQDALAQADVATIRWHKRQDFDAGRIDVWHYKPF